MNSSELLEKIIDLLKDKKAENIVVLDLQGKSSITDYMIIASGNSSRQVITMAEYLRENTNKEILSIEGLSTGDWVLVDVGDVIVHFFRPEVRLFYNLEKMWACEISKTAKVLK